MCRHGLIIVFLVWCSGAQSYRYFPVNLDVISWLGVWYVKSELYEKAIEFFERASEIQPNEVCLTPRKPATASTY